MAGYQYRATESRKRRAEAFTRQRATYDKSKRMKADIDEIFDDKPSTTKRKEKKVTDEFEIVQETPPSFAGTTGEVQKAAKEVVAVLMRNPGVWYRVGNRATKTKAASFTGRIREQSGPGIAQTRMVPGEGKRWLVYARVKG